MRLLLLTRYASLGASSRVRFFQFLPALERLGIRITAVPLLPDAYLAALYAGRRPDPFQVLAAFARRVAAVRRARRFDLIWIESEVLPWCPWAVERLVQPRGVPTVIDLDDAVFHRYDQHRSPLVRAVLGRKVDGAMRRADAVVAGNEYIAERARAAGARRVEIVPSVIDPAVHRPLAPVDGPGISVGWIGSPITAPYLEPLRGVFRRLAADGAFELTLVGAPPGTLRDVGAVVVPWREEREVDDLNRFDIGIMPVPDRPFERGKCGFKLVQYMSCGRASIASPVGANRRIVEHGVNGMLADGEREWEEALRLLGSRPDVRRSLGDAGRRTAVEKYSTTFALPRLVGILEGAAGGGSGPPPLQPRLEHQHDPEA